MKKIYIVGGVAVLVLALAIGYFQLIKPQLDNKMVVAVMPETVRPEGLPLEFTYQSGEAGYSLIEPPVGTSTPLLQAYILMKTDEYIKYQNGEYGDEAPPTISILVFDNQSDLSEEGKITRLQNWAAAHDALTSYGQLTVEAEVVDIDGEPALHYQADGLYLSDIYVASHRGNEYLFVGQYEEVGDARQTIFSDIIKTVLFN